MSTKLGAVFQHLGHGSTLIGSHVADTSDTRAEKSEASHPR